MQRKTFLAIVIACFFLNGCHQGSHSRVNKLTEDESLLIQAKEDIDSLLDRAAILEDPCDLEYLRPNLKEIRARLETEGARFIPKVPFLVEVNLNEIEPDEFLAYLVWLSTQDTFAGIRIREVWTGNDGRLKVVDETYQIFHRPGDERGAGSLRTPVQRLGLKFTARKSPDERKSSDDWERYASDVKRGVTWYEAEPPTIFVGDPREGVEVYLSAFDLSGREGRSVPLKCVFTVEE